MMDVWISEGYSVPYYYVYTVMVDGKPYDSFVSRSRYPLTWSEQDDIRAGYWEGLNAGG